MTHTLVTDHGEPERPAPDDPGSLPTVKGPLSVSILESLSGRARAIVYATQQAQTQGRWPDEAASLSHFVERAVLQACNDFEAQHNEGEPFPAVTSLPRGPRSNRRGRRKQRPAKAPAQTRAS